MSLVKRGTVYGTLMNFRGEHEALAGQMNEPAQPPVLYVKPANTWVENAGGIVLPAHVTEVEVGASIAMVMKSASEVEGYVLVNDLSGPQKEDGFLGIGDRIRARNEAGDPAVFKLEVRINGELKQTVRFAHLVRPADKLLADVSAIVTLQPGDLLMLGCDVGRPRARAGDRIDISMPALGTLTNTLVAAGAST
jgi:5-oxopent-3-ene-1,2,5-tricarboxylate decarboxylase/2-hydroxyhepta-2,4-diene-1,7-dioate isomerase